MKTFKQYLLEEIKSSSQKDYEKLLLLNYDQDFVNFLTTNDQYILQAFNAKPVFETNGNLIMKYALTKDKILLFGCMSKKGRLGKDDVGDMKIWLNRLAENIKNGKELLVSLNNNSRLFIENLLKRNPDFKKRSLGVNELEQGTWETVSITNN